MKHQRCLPGFEKAVQPVARSAATAPRADVVLMCAVEPYGIRELTAMLEALPDEAAFAEVRRLIVGLLAYRQNRDMKQERLF